MMQYWICDIKIVVPKPQMEIIPQVSREIKKILYHKVINIKYFLWTCNCSNSILGFGNKKELTRWKIVLANAYGSIWSNLILPYHQNHNYARFNNSHSKLKVKTFKGAIEWKKMTMALKTWALQKRRIENHFKRT